METVRSSIVWHNGATNETQIWRMNGSRIAGRETVIDEQGQKIIVGLPWSIVGVGNITGGGKTDIVWHNGATNETQIWRMNGSRIGGRETVIDEQGQKIIVGLPWSIVGVGFSLPRTMAEATAATLSHYPRVGGPTGPIGVPMDNVRRIPGGFMRAHSAGEIRFMDADIGPQGFHTKEASVRFVGFRCHQQSEGGPDEPYFIIGVQGYDSRNDPKPMTFGPFEGSEGVQTGDNRVLEAQLTTATSPPFVIHVTAMENDSGDPAEASAALEKGMKDGAAKLTLALAPISPEIVFAVGGAVQSFLAILGGPISDGLSALLGMGDDFIGQNSMQFFDYDKSKNEWLTPAPRDAPDFHTPHNVELVLDNGEGGRYSAFFQVTLFTIERQPVAAEK